MSDRLKRIEQLQQENQALREHLRMANNEISVANDKIAHCVHIRDANLKMHNEILCLREALKKIEEVTNRALARYYSNDQVGDPNGFWKMCAWAMADDLRQAQALAPQEGKQE